MGQLVFHAGSIPLVRSSAATDGRGLVDVITAGNAKEEKFPIEEKLSTKKSLLRESGKLDVMRQLFVLE